MARSSSIMGVFEEGGATVGIWPCGPNKYSGFRRFAPASLPLRGGPIREHRTDAKWLKPGKAPTLNRGTFGAKRRRGFGGLAPQCMKCHNRKTAAVRLPFCDSVGTVGECAIEVPTTLFFIDLRRNLDTPKCHEKSGQL